MYHGMKMQRRTSTLVAQGSWRRRAADAYFKTARKQATELRDELAARVQRLTGRTIEVQSVYTDPGQRLAVARVDGVLFHYRRGVLQVVRGCVHCDTGEFSSPTVETIADLGYALAAWQPRCLHCEPADSEHWIYED